MILGTGTEVVLLPAGGALDLAEEDVELLGGGCVRVGDGHGGGVRGLTTKLSVHLKNGEFN